MIIVPPPGVLLIWGENRQTIQLKYKASLCMLGNFFMFSLSGFSKIYLRNTIRVSKGLDPDQDRYFVRPDLGPSCLQRLSAVDSWQF